MGSPNIIRRTVLAIGFVALSLGLSLPAGATLLTDTIDISTDFGFPLVTATDNGVLVGAGVELTQGGGSSHDTQDFLYNIGDSIDIGASTITFNFAAEPTGAFPFAFTSIFSDLDWVGFPTFGLVGVTIVDPDSVLSPGAQANVLTASSFDFQGTANIPGGQSISFSLELDFQDQDTPVPGVPEPAILPLLAAGLMGLLYGRRRKPKP